MTRATHIVLPSLLLTLPALGVPLDFEAPLYSVAPLADAPGATANLPFTGQDDWSSSSSDSGGLIFAAGASGEYAGGQALRAADSKTVISAKKGYQLVDPATGTFTFDLLYGVSQELGVGWWRDADGDALWDQSEGQLQFGVVNAGASPYQFGLRGAGFGTRVGSGVAGTAGNWYRFVVNIGPPAGGGGGDRVITMRVRNLTTASDVDFNPATPGPQPWTRTVTAAQTGSAPDEGADGLFVRVSNVNTGIDNINGPPPPPAPVFAQWDAGGEDTRWTTAQNWLSDTPPSSANTLLFTGSDPRGPENDFPDNSAFAGITFDSAADSHNLFGAPLVLNGPLESASPAAQTISLDLTLGTGAVVNTSAATARIDLASAVRGTGPFIKTGPGEVLVSGGGFWKGGTRVEAGTLSLPGILSELTGDWSVSNQSTAVLRLAPGSSGEIPAANSVLLGTTANGTGSATLEVSGAMVNAGPLTASRGSFFYVTAEGQWRQEGAFTLQGVGGYGASALVTGLLTLTTADEPAVFRSGVNDNGRGVLIVDGGVVETGRRFSAEEGAAFPPQVFLLGGGTLRLLGNLPSLAENMEFFLGPDGAVIDTNGFSTSLSAPISGMGALDKTGAGVLTFAGPHSWEGGTAVSGGRLVLSSEGLADASPVSVAPSAILDLGFEGQDTVSQFYGNNVALPQGEWGAPGSGAVYESPLLAGTGRLLVTEGPTPYVHWLVGFPALNTAESRASGADPDGDGRTNLLEYALASSPEQPAALPLHTAWSAENGLTLTVPLRAEAVFEGPGDLVSAPAGGVVYRIQGSADLTDFTSMNIAEVTPALSAGLPALPAGWRYRTFHAAGQVPARHFLRVAVSDE